jgi:hypothetical protein
MSVLSSVFSRPRKGIQKRLNNLTHLGRAQSPPSPASFISPDVRGRPCNPYSLVDASRSSLNQTILSQVSTQAESSKCGSSPKVQIDLDSEGLSLADWFPAELLQSTSDVLVPRPERNVSLGAKARVGSNNGVGGNVVDGKRSESSLRMPDASASGRLRAGSHSNTLLKNTSRGRAEEAVVVSDASGRACAFEDDDVIIIEAPRGRDVSLSTCISFNRYLT